MGGWDLRQTCFLLGSSEFNTFCVAHLYNHTAFQRIRFPELLASIALHISQTTHTAVKGRNIWFFSNCRAVKKQEATSPRQQQSLLKAVGPFFSTNGKADKCPCPNSQSCFSSGRSGALLPREATGSKQKMALQVQRHTLHSGFAPGSTAQAERGQRGPHSPP